MPRRKQYHVHHHAPPGACLRLYRWRCDQAHSWLSTADAEYCPYCGSKTLTRERLPDDHLARLFPGDQRIAQGAHKARAAQLAARAAAKEA